MKHKIQFLLIVLVVTILSGCGGIGNKDNPMFGKVFREPSELPEFKGYEEFAGQVIDEIKDGNGDYKLAISILQKGNKYILILEEILTPDENGKVKYKILDTVNVGNVKTDQFVTYNNCKQGADFDNQLIVLVSMGDEDKEDYPVLKAWRADSKTGKINPVTDLKAISCFRVDECGYEEGEEMEESIVLDTMQPAEPISVDTIMNVQADTARKE